MSHGDDAATEPPDEFDIEAFHAAAVKTPSHEAVESMRTLLVETLTACGWPPEVDAAGNVVVSRGGSALDSAASTADGSTGGGDAPGPHFVLNTHLDTVAPHVPYEREGDVVRGRGACDAKGSLAALLAAFLRTDPGDGRLTLAVTTDEETTQIGGAHLARTLSADGYVVGEPTGLDVCVAARGQCEAAITVTGPGGHAASAPSHENPLFGVGDVLATLGSYDASVGPPAHERLGKPKLTPTIIRGGNATNRVPETVELTVDRRSVPPETSVSFERSLAAYLTDTIADPLSVSVELIRPETPFPEPFVTDTEAPLVRALQAASGGTVRAFGAATEASYFGANAPTVVFGPGVLTDSEGSVAHAAREYVALADLHAAAAAVETALRALYDGSAADDSSAADDGSAADDSSTVDDG